MKRRKTRSEKGKMPRNKLGKGNSLEFWKLHKTWHPKSVPSQCSPLHVVFSTEKLWFPILKNCIFFKEKLHFFKEKLCFQEKNAIFQGEMCFFMEKLHFFQSKTMYSKEKMWVFFKEKLCFLKEIWEQTTQPGYQGGLKHWERKNSREEYSWCSSSPINPSFGWSIEFKKYRARNRG